VTLPVVWISEAAAELTEAQTWYESRLEGLGERFARAVDRTITAIADNPLQFPAVYRRLRRAGVRRFPYGIFYQVDEHRVVVIACFHASRSPRQWRRRV
jgi:plasmid stabilization system protein ParE